MSAPVSSSSSIEFEKYPYNAATKCFNRFSTRLYYSFSGHSQTKNLLIVTGTALTIIAIIGALLVTSSLGPGSANEIAAELRNDLVIGFSTSAGLLGVTTIAFAFFCSSGLREALGISDKFRPFEILTKKEKDRRVAQQVASLE